MGTQVTANQLVGCRSRLSSVSSPGKASASCSTWSCSGWRRCGRSTSLYSNSGAAGSPSDCPRSTEPRARRRAAVAAADSPPAVGLPLHASSPSSLSLAVEAVEAVEQV